MREKQPLLKLLKCLHKYYRKESFTTLKMVLQLSWLTIAINFVEVFIVISQMLHFFCVYSMFFSKFGDGHMRDSMEWLKVTKLFRNLVYAHDVVGYERAYENLFNSSKIQLCQYNINMLFDKLLVEIEDHFKRRLLADGTFEGVYSNRFKRV